MNKKVKHIFIFFLCTKSLFSMRNPFFLPKKETTSLKVDKLKDIVFCGMGRNDKKTCAFIEIGYKTRVVFLEDNIFEFKIKDINKEHILLVSSKRKQKIFLRKSE